MSVEMITFPSRGEWLKNRRIGASESSCIVGMNPWKTNIELWEEKTGLRQPEDISDNDAVRYGSQAEAPIRQIFRLDHPELTVHYKKNNLWTNTKYPWASCSLDGWLTEKETGKKGVFEVKTTNILQSMQREKWKDQIPNNYYCQCLFAMAITEFEFTVLRAQMKTIWNGEIRLATRDYRIDLDDVREDMEYLMNESGKFAECVEKKIRPALILPAI